VAPEGVVNLKVDAEGSGSHQEFFYKESLPPPPPPPPPQERERAPALQPGETPEFKPLPSMSRIDGRDRFAPAEAARQEG